ncbi:UPF0236 family transposase-like protein [Thermanaeromonas toyohensis]|uniref:UPF0236 family transposase-like protein n=1 Tax=Thermanaeromonas toyohensis TaxID=161154 RepID=UPI0012F4CD93|nr:UPF0236 family protein [Thermanaeromonas toyohensis]
MQDNWEGLRDWRQTEVAKKVTIAEPHGLGASEAEINHVLAVRMKKRGMSWSECGGGFFFRHILRQRYFG